MSEHMQKLRLMALKSSEEFSGGHRHRVGCDSYTTKGLGLGHYTKRWIATPQLHIEWDRRCLEGASNLRPLLLDGTIGSAEDDRNTEPSVILADDLVVRAVKDACDLPARIEGQKSLVGGADGLPGELVSGHAVELQM
ncbi:hypothetical protein DB30_03973 [Enhygromyxa salina]|uniref:Uncharacterized protein n=1 Tax=Enhygromyxa salina TaxID=215803 RepID=A0A0C2D0P7_9BACT|nr:hypothetical protein DB30_03973 [Enhygromyxa salina]